MKTEITWARGRKGLVQKYYFGLALGQFPAMPEAKAERLARRLQETPGVMHSEELSPEEAIRRAVRAFVRHSETSYDEGLNDGSFDRGEARIDCGGKIDRILAEWSQPLIGVEA